MVRMKTNKKSVINLYMGDALVINYPWYVYWLSTPFV